MAAKCYIEHPNLPESSVTLAAIGEKYGKINDSLAKLGVEVIELKNCETLPQPVKSHADMMMIHLQGRNVVVSGHSLQNQKCFTDKGFHVQGAERELENQYPSDAILDCLFIGKHCFYLHGSIAGEIAKHCELNNIVMHPVRQGYVKCSVCVVDCRSLITADSGIANTARAAGFDVLEISEGGIELPGYSSGFIGGCSGLLAPDLLVFTGKIENHKDYDSIRKFTQKHHVSIRSLTNEPLMDIGSIIPLMEER